MKRETLRHPKTDDLASRLSISRAQALGHLLLMWDWTTEVALAGNIGKWPNGSIARACDWTDNADTFVTALVDSGWLDRDEEHRLVIHDWAQHCENWVRAKAQKLGIQLLGGLKSNSYEPDLRADLKSGSLPRDRTEPIQTKEENTPQAAPASPADPKEIPKPNRFQKPTVAEIQGYCREIAAEVDPHSFMNFYESNGWRVGKNPMRDWRAAIRNWSSRDRQRDGPAMRYQDRATKAPRVPKIDEIKINSVGQIIR